MIIFITLGSQKFQFNRLLKAVDDLVKKDVVKEKVFAQIGYSDYMPQHFEYKQFLDRHEYLDMEEKADIIIAHGGTGAIIGAVKKGKKVIAVPRLSKYGEHVDDHQLQLLEEFEKMGLIVACHNCEQLDEAIEIAKKRPAVLYHSNTDKIIGSIESFIQSMGSKQ